MHYHFPISQLPGLPRLIQDYLSKSETLRPFYHLYPSVKNFEKQLLLKRSSYKHRLTLVTAIRRQYDHHELSSKLKHNIDLLLSENAFTVATAHQPMAFLGPIYFFYKMLHVIQLAQLLKEHFPQYHFIPVYVMGSEDHDFDEINHLYLKNEKITWPDYQGGPIGRYAPQSILPLCKHVNDLLKDEPYSSELMSLLWQGYREYDSWADATRFIINMLLGQYGLVVLNPDDTSLKKLFVNVIKEEIVSYAAYHHAVYAIKQLEAHHYDIQAHPREINLFYIDHQIRERLVYQTNESCYHVLHTNLKFTREELLHIADQTPEKFSPNVMLRPLYQEILLPNLAYIGGPSELCYWLEQKNIFDHFGVPYPMLMLRNSITLIDRAIYRKLEKLQLPPESYFADEPTLIKMYLSSQHLLPDLINHKKWLWLLYEAITHQAERVDGSLRGTAEAQKQQLLKSLEQLEKKMARAAQQRQDTAISQIKAIRAQYMPDNILQERHNSILFYLARYGQQFSVYLLETIEPFLPRMNIWACP